jgi:regulatory protein
MGSTTITALKAQIRNPNRVNVYLDGEYAFSLARIVAAWLAVGQELSDAQIDKLQNQDLLEVAYQTALRALDYKARSASEITKKLTGKGFSKETIEITLERLLTNRLLDDERFARDWVENQSNFRPRGRRLLKQEMRLKGLDDQVIEQALERAAEEENLAYQAAQRPANRFGDLKWQDFRLKLSQFLARRGFTYSTVAPVVLRLWREQHPTSAIPDTGDATDIEEETRWTT